MKGKVLVFIIGVLVGAIIAAGGFYLYSKNNSNQGGMPDGNPPAMMQQDGNNTDGGTPPAKPDGDTNTDGQTPPDLPNNNNGNSNTNTNSTTNETN